MCILTVVDQDEAFAPITTFRNNALLLSAVVSSIMVIMGTFTGRTISSPVLQLVKGTEEISRGNLDYRIALARKDEIGKLATAFNQMASTLQSSLGTTAHSQSLLLALSQAAQAVQRARTPEEVYRSVGEEVKRLGFHAMVFNLTPDQSHLVIVHLDIKPALLQVAEKLAGVSAKDYRFPLVPGGIYERVVGAQQAIFFEQAEKPLAETLPKAARPLAGRIASILGLQEAIFVRLRVADQTRGLLGVTGIGLTEADLPAISAFANQTSIALEN